VRVSDLFSAERVIASVSPARFGPRRLAANEILIESPRATIRIAEDGSSNLDALLAGRKRLRSKAPGTHAGPSKRGQSMIEEIRLVGGALQVEWVGHGTLDAIDVDVQMRGDKVHGVLGQSEIHWQEGEWNLEGVVPRSAFDFERHGAGLQRVLAYGGALRVSGPRGRAQLQGLMLSHRVGGQEWRLSARTGVDRATGTIEVQGSPTLAGFFLSLKAEDAPLALLGPWLPAQFNPQHTTVSASVSLAKAKTWQADLDMAFTNLDIDEAGFSKRPLRMDLELDGSFAMRRKGDRFFVDSELRSLRTAELELSGRGSGEWHRGSLVPQMGAMELDLAEVECDAALNALPSALRPMLAGLELRGAMASHLELMVSRDNPDDTRLNVRSGIAGCRVVREPPSADTVALRGDYEHRSPDGQIHLLKKGAPGFTSIRQMPNYLPRAFVAAEDAQFFVHDGFDSHQIERSLAIDVQQGRFARGGSTISQQLVKNLFLHRKRTLARKLQEAALTWRLESNLDKKRILEIYLNIIEFGDQNTYGITAAAERWFGVQPRELTILQTAFLAAIVPEPGSMSARIREAKGLDAVSAGRVGIILRAMKRGHVISKSEYQLAKRQSLRFVDSALVLN
jgi:hypothetical protein